MAGKKLKIAVVGAGMGGLAVAATLRQIGLEVAVYEQAARFGRIGAGIQMMPNSMKVLRKIGIEERLRQTSFAPYSHLNRVWDTGEVTRELPMPESLYGAPYLCMHRATLHEALAAAVFTLSLILRIIDLAICNALPLGTHFLWHICNAIVLYLALRGAIEERRLAKAGMKPE